MKRIIVLFMMLILSIVLVGCSKEFENEKNDYKPRAVKSN